LAHLCQAFLVVLWVDRVFQIRRRSNESEQQSFCHVPLGDRCDAFYEATGRHRENLEGQNECAYSSVRKQSLMQNR